MITTKGIAMFVLHFCSVQNTAELRLRLKAFLQSFDQQSSWPDHEIVTSSSDHMSMTSPPDRLSMTSPRRHHKTTYTIFLKQNSIEQPVHVNIALHENDSIVNLHTR